MVEITQNMGLSLDDIMLIPQFNKVASRLDTDLLSPVTDKIKINSPLMATNMSTITEYDMAKTMFDYGGVGAVHRFNSIDEQANIVAALRSNKVFPIIASIGVGESEYNRAEKLMESGANVILIDVAHGHSQQVIDQLKALKKNHPSTPYIVGNIATPEAARDFLYLGANALRVGIGGGSRCTTRKVTGHGVPNLSALVSVVEERDAYYKQNFKYVPIIIDGGIKNSGDIVKALAVGADIACLGNMLAGTTETPGQLITEGEKQYKKFYGMSSKDAQDIHKGGMKSGIAAEGFSELVPYKGSVRPILEEVIGGIRSGLTYSGANNIKELRDNAKIIMLSPASQSESKFR